MKDEINEVYKKYSEAVTALWYFLTYARKNQKKDQQSILEIMEKFKLIPGDFIQKTGLIEISLTKEEVELTKKVLEETKQNLDKGFNILEDMAVIYLVALFDAFLVDILSTILTNKPEMMKSSKKSLTYEKIIELRNPVELIVYLVQKEMNEFSYKSIKEQAEYVSSRFGINIEDSGISQ